ncbi:MAG TPA: hypothetical protein VGN15_14115 [Ktedonobacteraceae bacterium]|nr:hypothetical protein [Ktedonobacteraceae bacterium]
MSRRLLYIIVGAIVVVVLALGVGVFVVLPSVTSANNSATSTPTPTVSATTTTKTNTVNKTLKQYAPAIKTQIAQGLKLTPDQLTTDLKAGKTLSDIATAQNVSATQLQTLVGTALQSGLKPAVDAGTLTQKQVDRLVKHYQSAPTLLDKILMNATTTA